MSFFKNISDGLKSFKDKEPSSEGQRGYDHEAYPPQHQGAYPPPQQGYNQYPGSGPPQHYPPQEHRSDHHGGAPQHSSPYGGYNAPPPSNGPPAGASAPPPMPEGLPALPYGWIAKYDYNYRHWYYIEESTSRTQWERPGDHGGGDRGIGGGYGGEHGGSHYAGVPASYVGGSGHHGGGGHYAGGHSGYGSHGGYHGEHHKEKSSNKGTYLAAGGGLVAGAVGGALIADALNDSDEERYVQQQAVYTESGPPGVLPTHDADGDSVSSSDREDVQEARERYEEALADAADSDASSSDEEALEEAREEYEEVYEEVYED